MMGPSGAFTLLPEHPGDVIFAATGTGIAPVISMLAQMGRLDGGAGKGAGKKILYWGLRHESDLFAMEELTELTQRHRSTCASISPSRMGIGRGTPGGSPIPSWIR